MPGPDPRPAATAGGFPIVAGIMLGAIVGFLLGQATIGFLIGGAIGVVIALAMWLSSRR